MAWTVAREYGRHPVLLAGLGIVLGAASAVATARSPVVESPHAVAVARGLVPVLYTVVGASVWPRRPPSRPGAILALVGLTYAATTPVVSGDAVWHSLGRIASAAWLGLFAYAFLSYPLGHLAGRGERRLLAAYAGVGGVLWLLAALFARTLPAGGPLGACRSRCPDNGLRIADVPAGVSSALGVSIRVVTALLLALMLALLLRRARSPILVVRLTIAPPLVAAAVLSVGYVAYTAHPEDHTWWTVCAAITVSAAIACPLSFGAGPLLAELVASRSFFRGLSALDPARMTAGDIESLCRTALGDPTARLARPTASYVLLVNRALAQGYERVVGLVGQSALALVQSSDLVGGLRSSRRRIAEHETTERARLERDLHDGAQQRLLALRMQLADLADEVRGSQLEPVVESIAREAETASAEVRTISHGIYPSLLVERGLADGIRALPASSSTPIRVVAEELPRIPVSTERAVYFAVAEAVQNATKHAYASRIEVLLACRDDTLEIEVSDDGRGFDAETARAGVGLLGLRDRIESAGGTVEVASAPGRGTRVTLRVPLA